MKSNVPERINEINNLILNVMPEFAAYIANKNIPLKERWEVFKEAPSSLSNHDPFMPQFENFDVQNWVDGSDRYSTYNTVYWIDEQLVESLAEYTDGEDTQEEEFERVSKELDPLREEILQLNLKSWTFDW